MNSEVPHTIESLRMSVKQQAERNVEITLDLENRMVDDFYPSLTEILNSPA